LKIHVGQGFADGNRSATESMDLQTGSREEFGKHVQALKNKNKFIFFSIFKHINQQQYQINTLAHKYGKNMIYMM
jgi:hypothetical protein